MTERTLRISARMAEEIQQWASDELSQWPRNTAYAADLESLLAQLDAHTTAQPAPDAVAEAAAGVLTARLKAANDMLMRNLGEQRQAAFEEAAKVAEEYSAENFRMATDSVVLDRAQRFENTEERQIEGNGHSAAGIAARNIAAAIRAASTPDR